MGQMLATLIREARAAKKLSQVDVAREIGVSRPAVGQWETGVTEPTTENLTKLCRMLDLSLDQAVAAYVKDSDAGDFEDRRTHDAQVARLRGAPVPVDISPRSLPKDVPVMGVAIGGAGADFYSEGEIVDFVRRPLGVSDLNSLYAIYVVGESMSPRYEPGDLLYLTRARAPMIGDDVVVELKPHDGQRENPGYIKRLVRRTPTMIVCEQFNPRKEISFPLKDVKVLHRVIPWVELLGV